jgi:DNA-binding NarL/FixJ family response regulator
MRTREISRRTSDKLRLDDDRQQYAKLSAREQSVLQHVAGGYSSVEIARFLQTTPGAVDRCRRCVAQKFRLTHRTDYLRLALRLGLIRNTGHGTITTGSRS